MIDYIKKQIESSNYFSMNNNEIRMNCPNCYDFKRHLYVKILPENNCFLYHCFKCEYEGRHTYNNISNIKTKKQIEIDLKIIPPEIYSIFEGNNQIRNDCIKYLLKRGLTWEDFEDYNICYGIEGSWFRRVVFPYQNNNNYFIVGRAIDEGEKLKVYSKGKKYLYNFEMAKQFEHIAIVEGIFDCILTGLDSVALLGSSLTSIQIEQLEKSDIKYIDIMLDSDETGKRKAISIARQLYKKRFKEIRIVELPVGDPASLNLRKQGGNIKSWINLGFSIYIYYPGIELKLLRGK